MIPTDRFFLSETQRHSWLQPECPVLVYSYRCCKEKRSGALFAQLRMVNRTDRAIRSVCLRIEGLDRFDTPIYTLRELMLSGCDAAPHTVFGEERLLLLERQEAHCLRITVLRVLFADGMLWRRLPEQALCRQSDSSWQFCRCGMPNPSDAESCALCGRALQPKSENDLPAQEAGAALLGPTPDFVIDFPPLAAQPAAPLTAERPAPIVRERARPTPQEPYYDVSEDEESDGTPRWLTVLTIIICVLAVLVAAGVLLYFVRDKIPMQIKFLFKND